MPTTNPINICPHVYSDGRVCGLKCSKQFCRYHGRKPKNDMKYLKSCAREGCKNRTQNEFCNSHNEARIQYKHNYYIRKKEERKLIGCN